MKGVVNLTLFNLWLSLFIIGAAYSDAGHLPVAVFKNGLAFFLPIAFDFWGVHPCAIYLACKACFVDATITVVGANATIHSVLPAHPTATTTFLFANVVGLYAIRATATKGYILRVFLAKLIVHLHPGQA